VLGSSLPIEPSSKAVDDAYQIGKHVFSVIVGKVDNLKAAALTSQQGIQIAQAKAHRPVFVFNDNRGNVLLFEQRQKLCSPDSP
jgi:hypothetical protein